MNLNEKNSRPYIGFSYDLPFVGKTIKCKIFRPNGNLIDMETPPIDSIIQLGPDSVEVKTADGDYILQLTE